MVGYGEQPPRYLATMIDSPITPAAGFAIVKSTNAHGRLVTVSFVSLLWQRYSMSRLHLERSETRPLALRRRRIFIQRRFNCLNAGAQRGYGHLAYGYSVARPLRQLDQRQHVTGTASVGLLRGGRSRLASAGSPADSRRAAALRGTGPGLRRIRALLAVSGS